MFLRILLKVDQSEMLNIYSFLKKEKRIESSVLGQKVLYLVILLLEFKNGFRISSMRLS